VVSACGASTATAPPTPAVLDTPVAPIATTAPSVVATTAPSVVATTAPSVAATTSPSASAVSSKKAGPSYLACGCGCCGGDFPPLERCLYHSKGDDLQKIIDKDRASAKDPICRVAGCSLGVLYSFCD
jgi:hypothetical protein